MNKNQEQDRDTMGVRMPDAKSTIDDLIRMHERKIDALRTLSNMLPTKMTDDQNNVVMSMVIQMGRS